MGKHRNVGKNNPMWGKVGGMFGKKHSKATKIKMSKSSNQWGENNPRWKGGKSYCVDCGKKTGSWKAKRCWKCWNIWRKGKYNIGRNSLFWKGGVTPLASLIRKLPEYKQWHRKVFERDDYICQDCGKRGGKLEAHHKKTFYKIFTEFLKEYDQFSPIEDKETLSRLAIKYKSFWDVSNGLTLCRKCHNKTKGRKKCSKSVPLLVVIT